MDSIFRRRGVLFVSYDLEIVVEQVNSDVVLSGVVLLGSSEEAVREEEPRDPILGRNAFVDPLLEPAESLQEILDVSSKSLQGWIALIEPHLGHLAVLQAVKSCLQVSGEEHFSLDCFLEVAERVPDGIDESVESCEFLSQHSVHTLLV